MEKGFFDKHKRPVNLDYTRYSHFPDQRQRVQNKQYFSRPRENFSKPHIYTRQKQSPPEKNTKIKPNGSKHLYVSAVDSDIVSQFQDNLTAQIYLRQIPVTALLDSGARMSLIDYDLLHTILPRAYQHMSKSLSKFNGIVGVTGDSRDIEGCFHLNMIIGNIHCSQIFHVVKKLQPECILGRDFLRHYDPLSLLNTLTVNFI